MSTHLNPSHWSCSALGSTGCTDVFGLAGMDLTFPTAAFTALCFVFVARTVLMTHQFIGNCWAVLAQHQGCLSNPPPTTSRLGGGQEVSRRHQMISCSAIQAKKKEEQGHLLCRHLSSSITTTKALLPRKWLATTCWWEVENKTLLLCF